MDTVVARKRLEATPLGRSELVIDGGMTAN